MAHFSSTIRRNSVEHRNIVFFFSIKLWIDFQSFFPCAIKILFFFCFWHVNMKKARLHGKIIFYHFLMQCVRVCSIIFYGKNRSSDKLRWGKCFTSVTYCLTMANTNAVMNMDQNYWTNVVDAKCSGSLLNIYLFRNS